MIIAKLGLLITGIVWGVVLGVSSPHGLTGPPLSPGTTDYPASCHYANPDVPAWGIECSYPNEYPKLVP